MVVNLKNKVYQFDKFCYDSVVSIYIIIKVDISLNCLLYIYISGFIKKYDIIIILSKYLVYNKNFKRLTAFLINYL